MEQGAQLAAIVTVVMAVFKIGDTIITKLLDKLGNKQDPVTLALNRNTTVIERQGDINQKILSFLEKQAEGAKYRDEALKDQLDRIETQIAAHSSRCAEKCHGKKAS